ncbi:MAG: hypothetical protein JNL52_05240 [Flavobacteriales bacterium]|nr:hypothetical protein [Flavobacteriales bacterium]
MLRSCLLLVVLALLFGGVCHAQDQLPFGSVEECFNGGRKEYHHAFKSKIRWPHDSLMTNKNLGRVYFDVELDTLGRIVNFTVIHSPNPLLEQEVRTKLLATQGLWKPLVVDGQVSPCQVRDHVYFEFR